ncbi:hypothetical protein, partial [Sporolituus thermophilus]
PGNKKSGTHVPEGLILLARLARFERAANRLEAEKYLFYTVWLVSSSIFKFSKIKGFVKFMYHSVRLKLGGIK